MQRHAAGLVGWIILLLPIWADAAVPLWQSPQAGFAFAAPGMAPPSRFQALADPTRSQRSAEAGIDPSQLCRAAIAATERSTRIPDAFLSAISRVESGRPEAGVINPWPWTVNAAGSGHFYATKLEAVTAVRSFLASGIRSLDVGCLQVNLFYHPDAFATLEQAFEPATNAAYAAKLLLELFQTTGSWPRAAAAYHSLTPALGLAYQQKVLEAWAQPDRPSRDGATSGQARSRGHGSGPDDDPARGAVPPPNPSAGMSPGLASAQPVSAGPPMVGYRSRFMLAQARPESGRSLSAYRATPVRLAFRPPEMPVIRH